MGGEKQEHIPPFVGLPVGGIAMNCPICKGLEEICESRLSEYAEARSATYYQISTELAAYKNVEMERAKRIGRASACVCPTNLKVKRSEENVYTKGRGYVSDKEARQSELGQAGIEYGFLHGRHLVRRGRQATMPVPSAIRQLSSAPGLGPKEQGSQIRAIKLARIVGS